MTRHMPLRVAVTSRAVYPVHGYGGLERHVYDLVRHLLARDVRVALITRPWRQPPPQYPSSQPAFDLEAHDHLRVHQVPYLTFPLAGRRGTTILDRITAYPLFGLRAGRVAAHLASTGLVDVVHGLGASALGYARARRRDPAATVPFVFNPQGLEEFGATDPGRVRLKRLAYRPLQAAVRACAAAADRVIATDRVLEPAVRSHLDLPAARVTVIPNAIDLARCDRLAEPSDGADMRKRLGIGPDEVLLLSVGRLEENKGFQVLARALGSLAASSAAHTGRNGSAGLNRARLPDWRWVLVGEGPFRATLERTLRSHNLDSCTVLLGRTSDRELHALYEAATLFVHPTLYEGSSLVTLEAMAHRRAVIATTAGGLPDKVEPGGSGWLVEPGNPDGLGQALLEALGARERLPRLGARGRAIVEREFTWERVVAQTIELYGELTSLQDSRRFPPADRRSRIGRERPPQHQG